MDPVTHEGCCAESPGGCVPAEFVRLRYYFGQRLGVADLSDAQAYGVGKQRFHNLRAHGAGVLCGLKAERFVFPAGAPPDTPATVLRVRRGAALDACGREVVVGADQCIDVAAWFARHRGRPDLKEWKAADTPPHALWVALRYRECPSDPAPAPRDPCGCDAGGCEFGRVREGFELTLLTEEQRQAACGVTAFPPASAVRAALSGLSKEEEGDDTGAERLQRALGLLIGEPCPDGSSEGWLCLARFVVLLEDVNGTPRVKDIAEIDNAIQERASLLSTGALQSLVVDLAAAVADEGLLGSGPRITGVNFVGSDTDPAAGTLEIPVELVHEGAPPAATPLAADTFRENYVRVLRFTPAFAWEDVAPAPTVTYDPTPQHPQIKVEFGGGLAAETRYRVTLTTPHETPVVDQRMRTLRPARFACHFRLVAAGGTLALAETLF
jgi:hypothetical protein